MAEDARSKKRDDEKMISREKAQIRIMNKTFSKKITSDKVISCPFVVLRSKRREPNLMHRNTNR